MPTSATGRRRREAGFTLVELLLVLTLMSLMAAAVVLTLPEPKPSLQKEAERFAARLTHARDAAILEGRTLGVRVDERGYAFLARSAGEWRPLLVAPFKPIAWSDGTAPDLQGPPPLRLAFDPTGLAEPAQLRLRRGGDARTVVVSALGAVEVRADAAP